MSYKHFGRIGDIWKHIPLCQFLAIERPTRYIETNSAFPEYQLSGSFEQKYGILHIQRNIKKSNIIEQSAYWKLLTNILENRNSISKYLGSPALALNLLGDSAQNFVFFDIEEACLEKISEYAEKMNLTRKTVCRYQDSVEGLISMVEDLGPHDFIHVDPYFMHKKNANNNSYYDAFCLAIRKGVMGMLWYGFSTLKEREVLQNVVRSQANNRGKTRLQGIEIMSILLGENTLDVNPGVLGCGILISNLSDHSCQSFQEMAQEVINIYRDSTMFDKYPGDLKCEEFEIQI